MDEQTNDFNFVLFGSTGDLACRKLLPALYQCHRVGQLAPNGRLLCIGRRPLSLSAYRAQAKQKARDYVPQSEWDESVWDVFAQRIAYLQIEGVEADQYEALKQALDADPAVITVVYLSTSPALFTTICHHLAAIGLNHAGVRVVLEKPLGHDLTSSDQINQSVARYFEERQIYRIDHYLGKESVQNLMALRFGNVLFEPLWRRGWIRDVQITIAEAVGVEGRGDFYETTGALRDMVQNHLLQLLCVVAMEPPFSLDSDAIRDEKLKVLKALVPYAARDVAKYAVRGQYNDGAVEGRRVRAYRKEEGVSATSSVETFVALRAEIANWRWAGVPFFLRTGKRMAERLAEIVIHFHSLPLNIFPHCRDNLCPPNQLVIRLQPEEYMKLYFMAKIPGDSMRLKQVHLDLDFCESFATRRADAYERLLLDVIRGNLSLFVRQDELEQAWRWVEPILEGWAADASGPKPYTAATWGPAASSALVARDGLAWHEEV